MVLSNPQKTAVLLVVFGSTAPETIGFYQIVMASFRSRFDNMPVYLSYTSAMMRKKSSAAGSTIDSITQALERMLEDGVTHAVIQSLHIIPGSEFHDIVKNALPFMHKPGGFSKLAIGTPLLTEEDDYIQVIRALIRYMPQPLEKNQAVVLMGHGTKHPSHACYQALAARLQPDKTRIYLGVMQGYPGLGDILTELSVQQIQHVLLMPFMSIAGSHATKDMAGNQPESWVQQIRAAGFQCTPILKGLAENRDFLTIWENHLASAMDKLI